MNRFLLCTVLLASSAAAFATPQATDSRRDIDKVNGSITAEAGQAYGDLGTVNGGIQLDRSASACCQRLPLPFSPITFAS